MFADRKRLAQQVRWFEDNVSVFESDLSKIATESEGAACRAEALCRRCQRRCPPEDDVRRELELALEDSIAKDAKLSEAVQAQLGLTPKQLSRFIDVSAAVASRIFFFDVFWSHVFSSLEKKPCI